MKQTPRIAVACSGLGHIQRGIESWAVDLTQALHRAGADVTLFGAGEQPLARITPLTAIRRTSVGARALAGGLRHLGGWRYGFGSVYEVEQSSFSLALWRRIRRDFDIVHVQDPMIGLWLERAHRRGRSRPAVVYANGTGEDASFMRRFRYLQLLTQAAADAWAPTAPPDQTVFMIPNFIDTTRFCPGDQAAARLAFGLPSDKTIILCCAAIRRHHKRIDVLLKEFAEAQRRTETEAMLVIAGGREDDTKELMAEGTGLLNDRVRFLINLPRSIMPDLYRAADAFVLPSLHEMFGIVLLEALSTGLPVLCNDTPDFRKIAGPGGFYCDLNTAGALREGVIGLLDPAVRTKLAKAGRPHVEQNFSETKIVTSIMAMYRAVQAETVRVQ